MALANASTESTFIDVWPARVPRGTKAGGMSVVGSTANSTVALMAIVNNPADTIRVFVLLIAVSCGVFARPLCPERQPGVPHYARRVKVLRVRLNKTNLEKR